MATPYPHKQTVVIFILCAVVVSATAVFVHGKKSLQNDPKGTVSVQVSTSTVANPYIETDADWQKSFFANSTSSPTKKPATAATAAAANAKITATDKFGREFLEEFANLKKAGMLEDADALTAATEKLLNGGALVSDQPDVYATADIRVSQQNDHAAFKEYGNRLGTIMKNIPAKNDAYIASQGIQTGTTGYLKELDGNISKYKTILKLMLEMRVPSELRADHTDFVNGVSATLFIATALRATPEDPIKSLAALNFQESTISLLFSAFQNIRTSLSEKGVTYAASEPGSYFNLKP